MRRTDESNETGSATNAAADSPAITPELKAQAKRWIEGLRRASAFTDRERRERLPKLTPERRLRQFLSLCSIGRPFSKERQAELDRIRIPRVLELHRKLRRASEPAVRRRDRRSDD
jgi:hypothetical protein